MHMKVHHGLTRGFTHVKANVVPLRLEFTIQPFSDQSDKLHKRVLLFPRSLEPGGYMSP